MTGASDSSHAADQQDSTGLTAILYLRVSTKEQAERGGEAEGFSIPAQRDACLRRAEALGATVIAEFVDRGESARSANRPELQQMLKFICKQPVSYVLVHKVDRLARNRADDVEINLALQAAGVKLVSVTENIDETPSGILLHGIMSSIAEFYSRNLANEVNKGMSQKAKSGGTVTKAPLGYRNVRAIDGSGREVRTVEVDPDRGPLVTWAFAAYSTGEWSMKALLSELTERGLRTRPGPKRPAKTLSLSQLQRLLHNPYYVGFVKHKGVEYVGHHPHLIDRATFDQVQVVTENRGRAGEKQRVHHHYLKGSLACGSCGSRMIVTHATNRWGTLYSYFVCIGRHQKRTNCTLQAQPIDRIEDQVIDLYRSIRLSEQARIDIGNYLQGQFHDITADDDVQRTSLSKRQRGLNDQQSKLLQAHYADAIPLDLMAQEQKRIGDELRNIQFRLAILEQNRGEFEKNLAAALDLASNCHQAYRQSTDDIRRQLNQGFFESILIDEDGVVGATLAEPFNILLSDSVKLAASNVHQQQTKPSALDSEISWTERAESDWDLWESSWNESQAADSTALAVSLRRRTKTPPTPCGVGGLNNHHLVGEEGLEPSSLAATDFKSAAYTNSATRPGLRCRLYQILEARTRFELVYEVLQTSA